MGWDGPGWEGIRREKNENKKQCKNNNRDKNI